MKKIILFVLMMFLFHGCGEITSKDGRIVVTTTVGMIEDVVKNVAGNLVSVQSLMGPGVDPHLYQPSAGDIRRLEDADLIFYVGLHLEGKMVDIFESLARSKDVFAVSSGISENMFLSSQVGQTGNFDPHIWFDVNLWSRTVDVVRDKLILKDPKNAKMYTENAAQYKRKLSDLDVWVKEQVATIPKDKRIMVTAHDAFRYFGRAYDIEVRGIQGVSTAADYGLKDLEGIINLIVDKKVKAVFVESSVPKKSIEALQQGVLSKGWDVKIGGQLFSDAMGDPNTPEGSYIGMVKYNVNTIVNSLK